MRAKFETLIEKLKQNPIITLVRAEIGEPIGDNKGLLISMLKMGGIDEIPDLLMEFYSEVGSIDIRWECNIQDKNLKPFQEGETELSGEVYINPLESLLMENKKYTRGHRNEFLDEEAEDLPLFRAIDGINDDYLICGFLKDGNKIPETLFYIQDGSDGFGMPKMTLNDYFDAIFKYKGFNGWQNDLIFDSGMERMNHHINQLFNK